MALSKQRVLLRILGYAALLFGLFTLGSVLATNGETGFPLWFQRDACAITMNPETGEMGGITIEKDWGNLALDILLSFVLAFLFYKWKSTGFRRKR